MRWALLDTRAGLASQSPGIGGGRSSSACASRLRLFGAMTFSSKYSMIAATSARNTGPTTMPMAPKAPMPPTTPTNTMNADTGA